MVRTFIVSVFIFCFLATPSFASSSKGRHWQQSAKTNFKTNASLAKKTHAWTQSKRGDASSDWGYASSGLDTRQMIALGMVFLILGNTVEPALAQTTAPRTARLSNRQLDRATGLISDTIGEIICDSVHGCAEISQGLMTTTTEAIGRILCPVQNPFCVSIERDEVVCSGSASDVQFCEKRVNDLESIREQIVPVTPAHGKTKTAKSEKLPSFQAVSDCLGFPADSFANLDVVDYPVDQRIGLEYDGAFNTKMADSFLQTLQQESPFFAFVLENEPNLIEVVNKRVFINYQVFNDYFGAVSPRLMLTEGSTASVSFPLDRVLKKIIAAVSGKVALERGVREGHFRVAKITDHDEASKAASAVNTKLYLDQSGSMAGAPIESLNDMMPKLLKELQQELKEGQMLNVKVLTFDNEVRLHQSMTIEEKSQLLPWKTVPALGSTNLIPIGEGLRLDDPLVPQMVIAFTDGRHNGPDLEPHYQYLKELQASGQFAEPFLCAVGDVEASYFDRLGHIFAGSVHRGESVFECVKHILRAIPKLVKPKKPIVLSVKDGNVVVWQEVATGVQTTSTEVTDGDTVTFGAFRAVVDTRTRGGETKEEKIERLRRELELLQMEL